MSEENSACAAAGKTIAGKPDKGTAVAVFGEKDRLRVALKLARMPHLSPREIEDKLIDLGYRGQAKARRAGAVLCYRHIQRLRRYFHRWGKY